MKDSKCISTDFYSTLLKEKTLEANFRRFEITVAIALPVCHNGLQSVITFVDVLYNALQLVPVATTMKENKNNNKYGHKGQSIECSAINGLGVQWGFQY